jgi:hypothetical protein
MEKHVNQPILRLTYGDPNPLLSDIGYLSRKAKPTPEDLELLTKSNLPVTLVANYSQIPPIVIDLISNVKGLFIGGGAAREMASGRKTPNDYDIFFTGDEAFQNAKNFLTERGFVTSFVCPKGTLTNMIPSETIKEFEPEIKIQLITPRFYSSIFDLIDSFDFTVCQFAVSSDSPLIIYTRLLSVSDALNSALRINALEYPVATLKRTSKYIRYGFTPSPRLFDEIALAIDELFRRAEEEPGTIVDIRSLSRLYID